MVPKIIQGTGNYAMHLALNYMQELYGFVLIPEKNELWISDGKKFGAENGSKINQISSIQI